MLSAFKRATQLSCSTTGTVLVAVMVFSACAYRYGIYMMLPDNFNYITYWQQLFEGSFHATSLQTPKPLLTLLFGALWKLTGSPAFLGILFIGSGTLAVYASAVIVNRICGPASTWSVLALLLPNASFLRAVLSGYSELLSAAGTLWLIARHLEKDAIKPPDLWTAAILGALNLIRPENWLLTIAVALTAAVSMLFSSLQTSAPGKTLWKVTRSFLSMSLSLLAPFAWFGFDYLAFGDPLFSFKVTAHFAAVTTTGTSQLHWSAYFLEGLDAVRNQVSLLALGYAVIGCAVVIRRRPSLLILLGLPVITTIAFYFVAYFKGLTIYDRFFFVPVLMILVVSCIGFASTIQWLLTLLGPKFRVYSLPAIGKRLVAVVIVVLSLLVEHRTLPNKIGTFDTYAWWRISALSAAEAVRKDSDYAPSRPVIVRVEDFALVGWALGNRNIIETQIYKRDGKLLSPEFPLAYFIINQPHQGKLFPELTSGRLPGFQTNIIYDDATTVVYKARRI